MKRKMQAKKTLAGILSAALFMTSTFLVATAPVFADEGDPQPAVEETVSAPVEVDVTVTMEPVVVEEKVETTSTDDDALTEETTDETIEGEEATEETAALSEGEDEASEASESAGEEATEGAAEGTEEETGDPSGATDPEDEEETTGDPVPPVEVDERTEVVARAPFTDEDGRELSWDVKTGHTVDPNPDGSDTYIMTVSVTATSYPVEKDKPVKKKLEFIYIVDESGSMGSYTGAKDENGKSLSRMDIAKQALIDATEKIKHSDPSARFALIGYRADESYGYLDLFPAGKSEFMTASEVETAIGQLYAFGNNDASGAFLEANQLIKDAGDPDATTVIILLCDGDIGKENVRYKVGPDPYGPNEIAALPQMDALKDGDYFFGVSVDYDLTGMQDLLDNYLPKPADGGEIHHDAIRTTSGDLSGLLEQIVDTVASNYDFVLDGELVGTLSDAMDFANTEFALTVTDAAGNPVTDAYGNPIKLAKVDGDGKWILPATEMNKVASEVKVTITQDPVTGLEQISLKFPANYQLEHGWTYAVQATIKVNDGFAAVYTGAIDGKGEPDTGYFAGKDGVYTSDADLSYFTFIQRFDNGESGDPIDPVAAGKKSLMAVGDAPKAVPKTLSLPRPVVQLIAKAVTPPTPTPTPTPSENTPKTPSVSTPVVEEPEVLGETRPADQPTPSVLGVRRIDAQQTQNARQGQTGETAETAKRLMIALGAAVVGVCVLMAGRTTRRETWE